MVIDNSYQNYKKRIAKFGLLILSLSASLIGYMYYGKNVTKKVTTEYEFSSNGVKGRIEKLEARFLRDHYRMIIGRDTIIPYGIIHTDQGKNIDLNRIYYNIKDDITRNGKQSTDIKDSSIDSCL